MKIVLYLNSVAYPRGDRHAWLQPRPRAGGGTAPAGGTERKRQPATLSLLSCKATAMPCVSTLHAFTTRQKPDFGPERSPCQLPHKSRGPHSALDGDDLDGDEDARAELSSTDEAVYLA